MLKIVIQIKEEEENKIKIGIKQLSEKEFNSSSQNEKITASEIKMAIEKTIKEMKLKNKKEEEK